MNANTILTILIILTNLKLLSKERGFIGPVSPPGIHGQPVINNSDSIIFNLANATLTPTYIDIPLYIKSDDLIFSFDFAMTFNTAKLTFSTTIDAVTSDPTFISSAFFNPNDLFLRGTTSTQQSLPANGMVCISKIRFALSAPCVSISTSDFTNVLTILNGTQCPFRLGNINFAQFIPNANFKTSPGCLNTLVHFTDSSNVGKGIINSWSWHFSNGTPSALQNNVTSYSITGTSATTLIVTTSAGCKDTIIKPLTISQPPVSSFSYTFNCLKDTVFFTNSSTISSGAVISSNWYFGDLTSINTSTNPAHHFNSSGFYKVKLTSTSNSSCTSTVKILISLRPSDINRDGITDVNDFLLLVPAWLTTCN